MSIVDKVKTHKFRNLREFISHFEKRNKFGLLSFVSWEKGNIYLSYWKQSNENFDEFAKLVEADGKGYEFMYDFLTAINNIWYFETVEDSEFKYIISEFTL